MDVPTKVLKAARDGAGLSQTDVAERLKVVPSLISKLEKAETTDAKMARRYLQAIATETAGQVLSYFERNWAYIERPPFDHPDRDVLWRIENALAQLESFEQSPEFDHLLENSLNRLRDRLRSCAAYLQRTDHSIAFIGEIGIGKTSALCALTGLSFTDKAGRKRFVFPTGSGRTTACEMNVKAAPAFGLAVDSLDEYQVRQITRDLVQSLLPDASTAISNELNRIIRNMSGFNRQNQRTEDGQLVSVDPIEKMLESGMDVDEVTDVLAMKMRLPERSRTQILLSQETENGLAWLSKEVTRINHGQNEEFSVPRHMTVLLPSDSLKKLQYAMTIIDTKGLESTTQRPDITTHLDDPRTLSVICAGFSAAPEGSPELLLRDLQEAGSDAVARGRVALLVLPMFDQALKVTADDGNYPETIEDGYLIKQTHIASALSGARLPMPSTFFFNSESDDPNGIWTTLTRQVEHMRNRHVARAQRLVDAAKELVTNTDRARSEQAKVDISSTATVLLERHRNLPSAVRLAHDNLITQIRTGNASSVWASVNRKGTWDYFDVHHMMALGVRNDAKLRTDPAFASFDEQLSQLKTRYSQLADVQETLSALQEELADWRQEFLSVAGSAGMVAYKPSLDEATELWRDCSIQWGTGGLFREAVARRVKDWFERTETLAAARERTESSLALAWKDLVVKRLEDACYFENQDDD
jgi:transcriptional regulator with XRE-family HTH domain